jgi:hypothetical protein
MRVRILRRHVKTTEALNKTFAFAVSEEENQMKVNAPWTDRTTAARNGLFGTVVKKASPGTTAPQDLEAVLGHSVDYGVWLETRKMRKARRPIVIPTLKRNNVMRTIREVFR